MLTDTVTLPEVTRRILKTDFQIWNIMWATNIVGNHHSCNTEGTSPPNGYHGHVTKLF